MTIMSWKCEFPLRRTGSNSPHVSYNRVMSKCVECEMPERLLPPASITHDPPPIIYNAQQDSCTLLPLMPIRFLSAKAPLHQDSRLHPASEAGCAAFQIHPFHPRFPLPAVADQVPKIPSCHLALLPHRARLFSRLAELLDTDLQPGAQVLGRVAEDLAHFCGNAGAVGVGVVERGEGVSDASRKPGR